MRTSMGPFYHLWKRLVIFQSFNREPSVYFYTFRMSSSGVQDNQSYKAAVKALNTLQSNASVIQAAKSRSENRKAKLPLMHKYLECLNIYAKDLESLNVIHIAGTKGKGSTAALCESILRHHGYSTGFYSSPHLVEVKERIRLDGSPISSHLFTKCFWPTFLQLQNNQLPEMPMPAYFTFLTLLAIKTFLQQKVDVAIFEVGIGGRFDCTNVFSHPLVCGITSLGLDHIDVLGETIEEIAWNKAGIFKSECPAVTVQQPDECMPVLQDCASKVGCGLFQAPLFDARHIESDILPQLYLMDGEVQLVNASLAVQLCRMFMDRIKDRRRWTQITHGECILPLVNLTDTYLKGLSACKWPGRFHQLHRPGVTYYFDGAHTTDSITRAANWFKKASSTERNILGSRSARDLMRPLMTSGIDFHYAIFCPNSFSVADRYADCDNKRAILPKQLESVQSHRDIWRELASNQAENYVDDSKLLLFHSVDGALYWLSRDLDKFVEKIKETPTNFIDTDIHLQVLVTGSILLVGNCFRALNEKVG